MCRESKNRWLSLVFYIEFDTMDTPPASEPFGIVTGTSASITGTQLSAQGSPGWPDNALEGGVLDPEANGPSNSVDYVNRSTFEVFSNSSSVLTARTEYRYDGFDNDGINGRDDNGEVFNMSNYAANPSNSPYGVNTDDPKWRTDLNPPSASSVVQGMNAYYNDAYIEAVEQTTGNTHAGFGFVRMTDQQQATVDVSGDSGYWCTTVGWAYESGDTKNDQCPSSCTTHDFYAGDDDPENEGVEAGYRVSTYGIADGIGENSERCMIFLEIQRDRGDLSVAELVSHEVAHCLGLEHASYYPATGFEASKDGIMGWEDIAGNYPCIKTWMDLIWGHTSPDRFSYQDMASLRGSADD